MMPEVVKEAAQRFAPLDPAFESEVTISVQGSPETFEVDAMKHFEDLTRVAKAVGVEFAITKAHLALTNLAIFLIHRLVAGHIAQQEETMSKLEVDRFYLYDLEEGKGQVKELLFALQQKSDEWSILNLTVCGAEVHIDLVLRTLARISANGSIGTFSLLLHNRLHHSESRMEDLKLVWEMSEKFVIHGIEIEGGRGADDEAEWQRVVEVVFDE